MNSKGILNFTNSYKTTLES
uniref:Uncharacterized protein n=1 Tax=Pristionchus pacificus TaxID=54126 RepID=A0A8R1V2Z1_PRIPA